MLQPRALPLFRRYEFNTSDLECSMMTLRMFLMEQEQIPWPALEYVIGQVGGEGGRGGLAGGGAGER
jgi:hypothetical protein